MKHKSCIVVLLMLCISKGIYAQIDVDSLLQKTIHSVKIKDYKTAIRQAQKGIKLSPEYLDFYLFLGRAYQMDQQRDSARHYLNYVIEHNAAYQTAFTYLINIEMEDGNYQTAEKIANKATKEHPDNKVFAFKKWAIYRLEGDDKKELAYLKKLSLRYPNDSEISQRVYMLETKNKSDRISANHTVTFIDREHVGPWHLGSLQYIRERSWGSLIARVNYADRFADGESVVKGMQYELESYFFTGKNSYSYLGTAYSAKAAFPEWRLSYSFFQNLPKGWESEAGLRYTKTNNGSFIAGIAGIGKYVGSYWFNLKSYFLERDKKWYPALTLTTRYYFNTRFDYMTLLAGYGTSPDERGIQGQISSRVALGSYRIGVGYFRMLNKHYLIGIQGVYNNQEYIQGKRQNEFEMFLSFQYKL